jgi:autotransporter strand-loop-strand O-heptosyltransferase
MKLKILYLAPHLSTGGMPAFLLKTIETLKNDIEIYVVEYSCHSLDYVVQRDVIRDIVKDNFKTLHENKMLLFDAINSFNPDIVHLHEPAERLDDKMICELYSNNRKYRIIETCHDVSFNPDKEKIYQPDAYFFCTPYHVKTFKNMFSYQCVIEFPIDNKRISKNHQLAAQKILGLNSKLKHVVNIGLWTPGKNQKEMLELAKEVPNVKFHFVGNQAMNFEDYWKPLIRDLPDNVTIWGERDDADIFMNAADVFMFNSTWECNPLVLKEAISKGKNIISRNLQQYENMFTDYIDLLNDKDLKNQLIDNIKHKKSYKIPDNNTTLTFKNLLLSSYNKVNNDAIVKNNVEDYKIIQHFVDGPFLEIIGTSDSVFNVQFWENDKLIYADIIKCNHWIKLNRKYYTNWKTIVYKDGIEVYNNMLNLENKKVFITFESSSLGDTIAWIPYLLEFKNKHNCEVIVSTFKNFLFEKEYPELKFVTPGEEVNNLHALYRLGWHYDTDKEPVLPNIIPLQQAATNILGLNYVEIKPRIYKSEKKANYKLVTIATNSTAGCKFWTREGWQKVINYLHKQGYVVKNVSLEHNPFDNCEELHDKSLENTMLWITQSEFFIGLSSGLSWAAWALDIPVVMISNFTQQEHEFECIRVINTSVCHGCWNDAQYKFDKGDYNWCPINKGTPKQFECQKSITSEMVIKKLPL